MSRVRAATKFLDLIPTIVPAAYASGDVIDGVKTLTNAFQDTGGSGILQSMVVTDKANLKKGFDVLFFSQAPDNSVGADNNAYGLHDDDCQYLLGRLSVTSADYVSSGTNNAEATFKNIGLGLHAKAGAKDLVALVVCRENATYVTASDLRIKLCILQD